VRSTPRLYRYFFGSRLRYFSIAIVSSTAEYIRLIIREAKRQTYRMENLFMDKSWRQPATEKQYSHDFTEPADQVENQRKEHSFHYKLPKVTKPMSHCQSEKDQREVDTEYTQSELQGDYRQITTMFFHKHEWNCHFFDD